MANYDLTRRGVVAITSSDTSPKTVSLPSSVKNAQSFRIVSIRDTRRNVKVQHGTISITDADVGGTKDSAAFTAVDTGAAFLANVTIREKRTDDYRGATVKIQSSTTVRATFNPPAAGDTIDIDFDVVESKPSRGATVRVISDSELEVEWDGTLASGETIDIAYEVVDVEDLRVDQKEQIFRLDRLLGFKGENSIDDLHTYDNAGNPVTFRIRTFDTAENLALATKDIPAGDPLEDGELSRVNVTLTWSTAKNRPKWIESVVEDVAETPGV